jgi:hypothetical protein
MDIYDAVSFAKKPSDDIRYMGTYVVSNIRHHIYVGKQTYSVDTAPLSPRLKLSINRTVFFSSGTEQYTKHKG